MVPDDFKGSRYQNRTKKRQAKSKQTRLSTDFGQLFRKSNENYNVLQTRLCLFNDCATFSRKNRFRRCCVCDIHLELRRVHGITWQYKFSIILRPIELLFSDKLPTISDTATSCRQINNIYVNEKFGDFCRKVEDITKLSIPSFGKRNNAT